MNAVEVEHVSIRFNLASEQVSSLKEYLIKLTKKQLLFTEFYALQDISFTLPKGESLGIVGVNGSGKSTLLKVIAGIYMPYQGSVRVSGVIAPLIELGAGFDGELTARENIFLNGALFGYDRFYMQERFEEIIDFAELWEFVDVPVRNYSSGMAARLGFAVATMVKPEILICDEILSVGDARFQKKCRKKMDDMLSGGTTLLFVSHSTDQVKSICSRAIFLEHGKMKMEGNSKEVCDYYLQTINGSG